MKTTGWLRLPALALLFTGPASAALTVPAEPAKASTVVSTTLEGVRVFPNPWRSDTHLNRTITFDRLPQPSTIKIFTLAGHEVRSLSADNGSASWDRTNDGGDKVASGIYLYLISDSQGNQTKGKLAIIR